MKTIECRVNSTALDGYAFQVSDDLPDLLPSFLSDWLTRYIEGGAEFSDGQTIQFGFWLLRCEVHNRRMRLLGPKADAMPVGWTEDTSMALTSMMTHKYIPESFGLEMDIPSFENTATVGRLFTEHPMFINRDERIDNGVDSGWFIGSMRDDVDNNDPKQLSVVSLYEASLKAPWIHDFLSLPKGTQVIFENERPVVCRDFTPLEPRAGSYFAERVKLGKS